MEHGDSHVATLVSNKVQVNYDSFMLSYYCED